MLLVEDDEVTVQSLVLMLGSEGFDVFSTDLGEEALDLVQLYEYGGFRLRPESLASPRMGRVGAMEIDAGGAGAQAQRGVTAVSISVVGR